MIPVYHTVCEKIAFYLIRRLPPGSKIPAEFVRKIDGTIPSPRDVIPCGSCNGSLFSKDVYQGPEWMEWFVVPEFKNINPRS